MNTLDTIIKELSALTLAAKQAESKIALLKQQAEENYDNLKEHYEAMRPYWAQGWSKDSAAAQGLLGMLTAYNELLGTDDHTAGAARLKELLAIELMYKRSQILNRQLNGYRTLSYHNEA